MKVKNISILCAGEVFVQVKSSLPEEMVTPDLRWELELMSVEDVCEFLKENGFPDHVLDTFRGNFCGGTQLNVYSKCVYLMHAMVAPQLKIWMDELSSLVWVLILDHQSGSGK